MASCDPRRRLPLLIGAAVFATALAVAILRVTALSDLLGIRLRMPWTMNDFKTAIYCPVAIFLQGGNPYDRAQFLEFCPIQDVFPLYLPSTLILHAPLGILPIYTATLLYFCISVALSVLIVRMGLRLAGAETSAGTVLLGAGILLLSRPGQWNLLLGQPALELAIATYIALFWARRAPLVSGVALAVSMYKPTFGVPLAVLMFIRGDRLALVAGVLTTAVLNVPPLAALAQRAGGLDRFAQDLVQSQKAWQAVVDPSTQVYGVDTPGLVSRLAGRRLGAGEYLVVTLIILSAAGAALRSIARSDDPGVARLSATVVCLGILLSVHHQAYDLVLLVAPAIAVAWSALPKNFVNPRRRLALLALIALLGLNYVTTLSVLHRLNHQGHLWLALASLNGAILLTVFLIFVIPLLVSTGRTPSWGTRLEPPS
jgi:hypothetical protein